MPPTISSVNSVTGVVLGERSSSLWLLLGGVLTGLLLLAHQLQLQPGLSRQLAQQQSTLAIAAPIFTRVARRPPTPRTGTASTFSAVSWATSGL